MKTVRYELHCLMDNGKWGVWDRLNDRKTLDEVSDRKHKMFPRVKTRKVQITTTRKERVIK